MKNGQSFIIYLLLVIASSFFYQHNNISKINVYDGLYELENNQTLKVFTKNDKLVVKLIGQNLLDYSDSRVDSRVRKIEGKTKDLIEATLANNRKKISELFIESNGAMEEYIDGYFETMKPVINSNPEQTAYKIISTIYRDEDSNYGFGDQGWGWETYILFQNNNKDIFVRIVWDGITGKNVHRGGIGKLPPKKEELEFSIRKPSRSWIKAYDPSSQTIVRVREVDKSKRMNMIPARFIAYDIDTHSTIGIRFRKEKKSPMSIELGPLGSNIIVKGHKIDDI